MDGVRAGQVAACALLLVLAGCGADTEDSDPALAAAVAVVPAGYALAPESSGPLESDQAAKLLQGDSASAGQRLRTAGYRQGSVRVLRSGGAFATVAALQVKDVAAARALLKSELFALRSSPSALVQQAPGLTGGHSYVLDARTRAGKDVLCQGALVAQGPRLVLVATCGPHPNSPDVAVATAAEVIQRLDREAA